MTNNAIMSVDNNDPTKVKINVLTKLLDSPRNHGMVYDWLNYRHYNSNTMSIQISSIQKHFKELKYTDQHVKSIWLSIEGICTTVRKQHTKTNLNYTQGQMYFPTLPWFDGEKLVTFHLLQDSHLFNALLIPGSPFLTIKSVTDNIHTLRDKEGWANIFGAIALYQNFIGEYEDAILSCSFFQLELLGPDAARGKKVHTGAKDGHTKIHGTSEEKKAKWAQYQQDINNFYLEKPNVTYKRLCELTAKKHDCSAAAVKLHTTNPKNSKKQG